MTDETRLTSGGSGVKRGYTFDPEDARTTYRYRLARGILATLGAEPTVSHDERGHELSNTTPGYGRGYCTDGCKTTWPEWVTNDIFNDAYALASKAKTASGAYYRGGR